MSAIEFLAKVGRRLLATVPAVVVLLLAGCNPDPYPEDLKYPLRSDVLVLEVKLADRELPQPLGSFEQAIQDLKSNDLAKVLDPAELPEEQRARLTALLEKVFGTPAQPTVAATKRDDKQAAKKLGLDAESLARGSTLYRRHCVHCHGLTGDGRGPTATWVDPHLRDYRRGFFKFTSVETSNKPLRSDLLRTLRQGIEGTSMPAHGELPEQELNDLVSYVIHLSLRGAVEYSIMEEVLSAIQGARKANKDIQKAASSVKIARRGAFYLQFHLDAWANTEPIKVLAYPYGDEVPVASVRRGHALFIGTEGACITCHFDYGRQGPFKYDVWGTLVRPANLTAGVYRGGRRPVDIYYRIHGGINPSGMSGAAFKQDARKMWDMVNFVKALPYPRMLPPDVSERIYGTKKLSKFPEK